MNNIIPLNSTEIICISGGKSGGKNKVKKATTISGYFDIVSNYANAHPNVAGAAAFVLPAIMSIGGFVSALFFGPIVVPYFVYRITHKGSQVVISAIGAIAYYCAIGYLNCPDGQSRSKE